MKSGASAELGDSIAKKLEGVAGRSHTRNGTKRLNVGSEDDFKSGAAVDG